MRVGNDRSGKWMRWFAWYPVDVHLSRVEGRYNPDHYGPNAAWENRWWEWVEWRPILGAYEGTHVWSKYVYRVAST